MLTYHLEAIIDPLKQTGNSGSSKQTGLHGSDLDDINYCFANIASDPIYSRDSVTQPAGTPNNGPVHVVQLLTQQLKLKRC